VDGKKTNGAKVSTNGSDLVEGHFLSSTGLPGRQGIEKEGEVLATGAAKEQRTS